MKPASRGAGHRFVPLSPATLRRELSANADGKRDGNPAPLHFACAPQGQLGQNVGVETNKGPDMKQAVIEDWDKFSAFLASQPLCQWSAQKQREVASGMHSGMTGVVQAHAKKKDDNADLVAALASMA